MSDPQEREPSEPAPAREIAGALFAAGALLVAATALGMAVTGLGLASSRSASLTPRPDASAIASIPTAASVQVPTPAPTATSNFTFSTPTPQLSADITFSIVDEAGRPLPGATVDILSGLDHGLTDDDGTFRSTFALPPTTPPTLRVAVRASKAGFDPTEAEVRVAERAATLRLRPITQIAAGQSVHLLVDEDDSELRACMDVQSERSFPCRIIHVIPAAQGTRVLARAAEPGVGDLTLELAPATRFSWSRRQVLGVSPGADITALVLWASAGSRGPVEFTLMTSLGP